MPPVLTFPDEIDWADHLEEELSGDNFQDIQSRYQRAIIEGKVICPNHRHIFRAYELTPLATTKVVILGQDPYHQEGIANGLAFSVSSGQKIPASLRNIFKELSSDLAIPAPIDGDLSHWAAQGVLLLNTTLTVEKSQANSHKSWGWTKFTDATISILSEKKEGIIFLFWGKAAESKKTLVDENKHHVIVSAHPSPLARGAFSGSRPFSRTNNILISQGQHPIAWG